MGTIAIITARGGSKRIPKKNIKDFMGKPMIAYAISACVESDVFEEVMVSTDSQEIADVAMKFGAKVPFMRSEKTSDDFATTFDVVEEVVMEYKKRNHHFDSICCVYPCVPFLKYRTLCDAFKKFEGHDALMPVCKYPVPIEWAMRIENDLLVPNDRNAQNMRSQDIEPKYFDVGMFYFCKTAVMLSERTILPKKTIAYEIEETECQDIDTFADWKNAEIKFRIANEIE